MNINDDLIAILDEAKLSKSTRGCYLVLLTVIGRARPERRASLWTHFLKNRRLPLLPELRAAFELIEAKRLAGQLDVRSPMFNAKEYAAHAVAQRKKTADVERASDGQVNA